MKNRNQLILRKNLIETIHDYGHQDRRQPTFSKNLYSSSDVNVQLTMVQPKTSWPIRTTDQQLAPIAHFPSVVNRDYDKIILAMYKEMALRDFVQSSLKCQLNTSITLSLHHRWQQKRKCRHLRVECHHTVNNRKVFVNYMTEALTITRDQTEEYQ